MGILDLLYRRQGFMPASMQPSLPPSRDVASLYAAPPMSPPQQWQPPQMSAPQQFGMGTGGNTPAQTFTAPPMSSPTPQQQFTPPPMSTNTPAMQRGPGRGQQEALRSAFVGQYRNGQGLPRGYTP